MRTSRPRGADAPAAAAGEGAGPLKAAAAPQPYTTPRFLVTGRQSMTVNANDAQGAPVRKQVAFVSLVPVGDDGEPLNDNVGALSVAGATVGGGAGGPLAGEFRVRIPSITSVDAHADGSLVVFASA